MYFRPTSYLVIRVNAASKVKGGFEYIAKCRSDYFNQVLRHFRGTNKRMKGQSGYLFEPSHAQEHIFTFYSQCTVSVVRSWGGMVASAKRGRWLH